MLMARWDVIIIIIIIIIIENTGIQDTGIEINTHYLLLFLNITNVLINCISTYLTFIIIIIIPVNTTKS